VRVCYAMVVAVIYIDVVEEANASAAMVEKEEKLEECMLCFEEYVVGYEFCPRCTQCNKQWCTMCDLRWRLSQRYASIQATCPFCRHTLTRYNSPTVFVRAHPRRAVSPIVTKLARLFSCIFLLMILLLLPILNAYIENGQTEVYVYIAFVILIGLFLLCYFMNRAGLEDGEDDTIAVLSGS